MKNYRAEITGVFGDPVDDNPTGVVEEAAYAAKGLNYRYLTLKVRPEDLEEAMKSVRIFDMRGINLTMPHKIRVIPYLDELSEAARIIGAVNTVINDHGKLIGENTDGKGFISALEDAGVSMRDQTIVILGAGGAARAISVECALAGAKKITIMNRTVEKAAELAKLICDCTDCEGMGQKLVAGVRMPLDTDIVINATSIGLKPHEDQKPDIDYDSITGHMHACDVVFNPADTLFLQEARKRGAVTHSGLGMLVRQAALNFTLWTGQEAPLDVMTQALEKEFE